jgi:hypothetical protein
LAGTHSDRRIPRAPGEWSDVGLSSLENSAGAKAGAAPAHAPERRCRRELPGAFSKFLGHDMEPSWPEAIVISNTHNRVTARQKRVHLTPHERREFSGVQMKKYEIKYVILF